MFRISQWDLGHEKNERNSILSSIYVLLSVCVCVWVSVCLILHIMSYTASSQFRFGSIFIFVSSCSALFLLEMARKNIPVEQTEIQQSQIENYNRKNEQNK